MADVVLTILIKKLDVLLTDEFQLQNGVRPGIDEIKVELGRMRDVLRRADANSLEGQKWVQEVRMLAFNSEDVLDEYLLHIAYSRGRGMSAYPKYIIHLIKNIGARHNIGSAIQYIKLELEKMDKRNQRHLTYRKLMQSGVAPDEPEIPDHSPQEDVLLVNTSDLVGIDEPKKELISFILSDGFAPKVISVVAMGGLGKTTLVKAVYEDPRVEKKFQRHAWITVSQKYNSEHLLRDLIRQLCKESMQQEPHALDNMTGAHMKKKVNELLQDTGYLIVLDDVWSINAWKSMEFAFPVNKWSSRIILTTRNADVALDASKSLDQVYNLQPLSEDKSWTLFCNKAFVNRCCPNGLRTVSGKILKKCGGMPLAIVTIGGVLITKNQTSDEWEKMNSELGAELDDNNKLGSTYKILSLSYHSLPYHLKLCFLYMSIFPEDYHIECPRLIRLWISEGFVQTNGVSTLEQVAENHLNALINRNLIQVAQIASDGRVRTCRIHDLLRDIIVTKSKDQNIAAITKADEGQLPDNVRRLSLQNSMFNIRKGKLLHQLRSLILFDRRESEPKPTMHKLSCRVFKLLIVLDLQDATLKEFPTTIVKLGNLRYLSFRNTKIHTVPGSIGLLQKLETLDLKHTTVTKLPIEIRKLKRLRNLLLYHYEYAFTAPSHYKQGFQAPPGIGDLQSLQKLCCVEAGPDHGSVVKQLGRLTELRRLGIIKLGKENHKVLCSSIAKLSKLQALSITSANDQEQLKLKFQSDAPLLSLQRLYLTGKLKALPPWMKRLENLVKIFLKSSRLSVDPLETFEELPGLVHMELLQVYTGPALCFRAGKFGKLKILGLHEFNSLETMTLQNTTMPNLERFTIQRCERMKAVPSGIEYLTKLKVLEFVNMPRELITTMHPHRAEAKDYCKVQHIGMVNFTYDLLDRHWTERLTTNTQEMDQQQSPHDTNAIKRK